MTMSAPASGLCGNRFFGLRRTPDSFHGEWQKSPIGGQPPKSRPGWHHPPESHRQRFPGKGPIRLFERPSRIIGRKNNGDFFPLDHHDLSLKGFKKMPDPPEIPSTPITGGVCCTPYQTTWQKTEIGIRDDQKPEDQEGDRGNASLDVP